MTGKRKRKQPKRGKGGAAVIMIVAALTVGMVGTNWVLRKPAKEAAAPERVAKRHAARPQEKEPVPAAAAAAPAPVESAPAAEAEPETPAAPVAPKDMPDAAPEAPAPVENAPAAAPEPVEVPEEKPDEKPEVSPPAPAPPTVVQKETAGGRQSAPVPPAPRPRKQDELHRWMQRSNAVYSLHEAAAAGDIAVVRARLAEEKVEIEKRDEMGCTPLFLAARSGNQEIVELLLEKGADLTARGNDGKCAADFYEGKPQPAAVQQAFHLLRLAREAAEAIGRGDAAKLQECLGAGVDPNGRYESRHLLQHALDKGEPQLVSALLAAGANPDTRYGDGKPALHVAAARGRVDLAKLLIEKGADYMAKAPNGALPLHEAVWFGKPDMLDYLLPFYKKHNYNPSEGPNTVFPVCMAIFRHRADALELFIRHGLDVNDARFAHNPLLTLAVRCKNAKAVEMLLRAGARKDARDKDGKLALDYADEPMKPLLR